MVTDTMAAETTATETTLVVTYRCSGPMPNTKQCTCVVAGGGEFSRVNEDLHFCSQECSDNYDALVRTQEAFVQQNAADMRDHEMHDR